MADSNDSQSLASRLNAVAAPTEQQPVDSTTQKLNEVAAPSAGSDLAERLKSVAAPIEAAPKEEVSPDQIKSAALGVGGQFAVPYLSSANPEKLTPEEKQAIVGLDGKSLSQLLKANKGIKLSDVSTKDLVPMYRKLQEFEDHSPESDTHPLIRGVKAAAKSVAEGIHGLKTIGTDLQSALGPVSPIFGIGSTPTGALDAASSGIFSPDDSYDSRYQSWALQAYNARQKGQPIPEKPAPPKEGEKSAYYQNPEAEKAQEDYQKKYAEWAKSVGVLDYLTGKGMPKAQETKEPTEAQKIKEVGLDAFSIADKTAGSVKDIYQTVTKINEGGTKLTDDIGVTGVSVDPKTGFLSIQHKSPTEKLINRIARDEIDADRERVKSKSPSNIGQILYYAGEQPTESGQQSYAQLFRPIIASYLVPSVRQRMLDNPNLTEAEATKQWLEDSDKWGSATLQKAAQAMPKPKEDVGTAAEFLLPQYTTSFGLAGETLGQLSTGLKELGRLSEVEEMLPQARAMTDTAQTAREGGVFYVDPNGNVTAAPKSSSGPRTKEQLREDWNNAEQLHADMVQKTNADNFERSGCSQIRLGPWNIPKPFAIAGNAADSVNNAADFIKKTATTGALATVIPATTGAIGAYQNRNQGLLGMGAGFLKGIEYGAAGELAGYGALKTAGKTLGLLSDLGKVSEGLQGTGGNVFQIAGNLPTSTDLTRNIFGGKIGKITAPTANWLANNLVNWTYEGVQAGALAGAMGVLDSTPYQDLPEQAATGAAMMLMPHILTAAIHETPAAREKRIAEENNQINQVKAQASPDSIRTASQFSDYREVVNNQKQISADKNQRLRELVADPKSKPEDIKQAQKEAQEADQRLTQVMSANSETRLEYGRQNDLLWAKIHRGLNGPIRAGQGNIGIEILTKDQILQKLVDANKELASTPQGMAKLEMIAGQDGMVINSAGGVELRAGTDLAEALKNDPIMFDPSKTTAIINADNARRRAGIYGTTTYDALSHEGGHLYGRTKEFQEANAELLNTLFSTNVYHDDGRVASEDVGAVSNDQLKDMIWNNYLRGRTDEQKKAWLESQGMWDRANDRFIDKEVIPYAREEYIAEMAGNALHSMVNSGGETAVMKWARTSNSNNMLARAIQAVLGVGGPDPRKPSPVMGIEFTPEIRAATEKAIQAVNDYNGHIAPVIDAEPVVEITQKDLKKNKGLLKKYGVNSGMFQTQVYATIRDSRGNVVSKVPIANEAAAEGSWKVDPATGKPVQTKGYGQIPDEVTNVQIPQGGSLDVQREVAMQPDGQSPILLSDSQQKKNQKARRDLILNALGITGEIPEEGITWRGTFTPEQIQNIKNLPENVVPKSIKDVILSMNETLASGEGQRWLTEYSPTSGKKGKRKSIQMKQYDVVPIGMHFTKDGNFNVTVISATRIFNKIHAWGAEFPHILDMWNGSKSEFFNDFVTKYLANWKEGKEGWEGLDPDEKTAKLKRDIFNNFLNLKDKDTEFKNQNRFYLKGKQADLDRTIMSMRADHVSSLQPSSAQPIPVDYYKAKINAMPESGLPYQERPEEPAPEPREEERKPSAIDLGITAAHSREAKPFGAQYVAPTGESENTRTITRQYGDYPKGTQVIVIGEKSKDPLSRNIDVQFPDGKVESFPLDWLKTPAAKGEKTNLPSLIKERGRDAVNVLIGEWDQNAQLNEAGTGIVSAIDPRQSMRKTKVPTSDFTEWLKGQDVESIIGKQVAEEEAPTEPERITEATYTNPRTGEVSRGATHTIANPNAPQEATDRESPAYGFATDKGRIVDRSEAYNIAQAAGQLKTPTTEEEKFHAARGVLHSDMVNYEGGKSGIAFMPSKLDEAHAKAIESGDTEEAQRLVDEAARKAGYTIGPVYHATNNKFNVFQISKDFGYHFGTKGQALWKNANNILKTYLSVKNPLRLPDHVWDTPKQALKQLPEYGIKISEKSKNLVAEWQDLKNEREKSDWTNLPMDEGQAIYNKRNDSFRKKQYEALNSLGNDIKAEGYDGVVYSNEVEGRGDSHIVFDSNQAKSADPATYDDQGNLIPLSQRFNPASNDIRFMPKSEEPDITEDGHVMPKTMDKPFAFTPKVFTSSGQITAQPLMTVMPIIDQVLAKKALDTLKAYTPPSN